MNSLKRNLLNRPFSHIYIEEGILHNPNTQKILSRFPNARPVNIGHYKDVFCRSRQNYSLQKQTQCLILAKKRTPFLYDGAPVCQDFGNQYFYYATSVMNCIFNCEYCYLKGMYPSANLVVFVNLEEILDAVENVLKQHPVYLCISYDTDLLAMEDILGYVHKWFAFAARHQDLTVELRTKSANLNSLDGVPPLNNIILAWTLSPEPIRREYEHNTPSLDQRLTCVHDALKKGFRVRLCFDPLLFVKDWQEQYKQMVQTVFSGVPAQSIADVSIGSFRMPQDYLKRMRKSCPDSVIVHYPFEVKNGIAQYSGPLSKTMTGYLLEQIKKHIPKQKIYIWNETE